MKNTKLHLHLILDVFIAIIFNNKRTIKMITIKP